MSQHLPIRIVGPLHRQCRLPLNARRPFSSTIAVRTKKERYGRTNALNQMGWDQSRKDREAPATSNERQMRQTSEDMGLLPKTFIRASAAAPPFLPQPIFPLSRHRYARALGDRWKYELEYIKRKPTDLWTMLYYKWWARRSPFREKPKQVFYHKKVREIAKEYYERLYGAFASENLKELESICAPGLVKHFQTRLESRPKNIKLTWKLLNVQRYPRVVSNRMAYYPVEGANNRDSPSTMRQVVFRMKTRQLLTIERLDQNPIPVHKKKTKKALVWTPDGVQMKEARSNVEGEPQEESVVKHQKDVVEYLVLQQRMMKGVLEPWKVWGFTEKTTLERILEEKKLLELQQEYEASLAAS